ncbi:MAG: class I SAM-dependent methyltransferase [Candidatus Andersenbacteria bacterium]|nr:class I SAM-dependent methyltransferase [Candidatus Andersenbacteria bacterium]
MYATGTILTEQIGDEARIATCYDVFDAVLPACGILDLSEGMYEGDPQRPYWRAQERQLQYLLDQIGCKAGSVILDIGCGNGTLLAAAQRRRAQAIGFTLAPAHVRQCQQRELDVRLLNYRKLPKHWQAAFDGIVANGSLEHFVQPAEAAAGLADAIYREFFEICHWLLRPHRCSRLVTAAIHYRRFIGDPVLMQKSPTSFAWGSDNFHMAILAQAFGGSYPQAGQLQRCSEGMFELIEVVDGTEDYRLTSEWGLEHVRRCLLHPLWGWGVWARFLPAVLRNWRQGRLILLLLWSESWQWQFRGDDPPMRLFRHTWQRID